MSRKKQYDENDVGSYTFLICSLQQNSDSCVFGVNDTDATTTENIRQRVASMKDRLTDTWDHRSQQSASHAYSAA